VQNELHSLILDSKQKENFCTHDVIQMASNFLTEASAMSNVVCGSYAPVQSALAKLRKGVIHAGFQRHTPPFSYAYGNGFMPTGCLRRPKIEPLVAVAPTEN